MGALVECRKILITKLASSRVVRVKRRSLGKVIVDILARSLCREKPPLAIPHIIPSRVILFSILGLGPGGPIGPSRLGLYPPPPILGPPGSPIAGGRYPPGPGPGP